MRVMLLCAAIAVLGGGSFSNGAPVPKDGTPPKKVAEIKEKIESAQVDHSKLLRTQERLVGTVVLKLQGLDPLNDAPTIATLADVLETLETVVDTQRTSAEAARKLWGETIGADKAKDDAVMKVQTELVDAMVKSRKVILDGRKSLNSGKIEAAREKLRELHGVLEKSPVRTLAPLGPPMVEERIERNP